MIVRKASVNDIDSLISLEKKCFDEHIRENFDYVLLSDSHVYFVIEKEKNIVAYAGASISYEQGDILSVCVDEKYRNMGYAVKLLNEIFSFAKTKGVLKMFLEVEEDNIPAVNLYAKLGFVKISERKNYYGHKTALIMVKEL